MHRFALALVLAMSAAGPTAASDAAKAPAPEDRYLWLEDVDGREGPRLGPGPQRRERQGPGDRRLRRAREAHPRHPRLGRPHPVRREARALVLQLLARREEPPRALAAHDARRVPQGAPGLGDGDRPRRARRGREGELGLARGRLPEAGVQALPRPLSRGGADADVVREFDLEAKAFVKDGFFLPEAKSSVGWLDADTLYVGTDFGPGSMTTSGYPRIAKVWKRGTPLAAAETVYEGKAEDVAVGAFRDHTQGLRARLRLPRDHLLHERDVPAARRQARSRSTSPTARTPASTATCSSSSCATTGRSAARPTPRGRSSPRTSRAS